MKAIRIIPGTTEIELAEVKEPQINNSNEVKMKVLEVGICGTDKEEVAGGRAEAPAGEKKLIIGHEVLAEVVECGGSVTHLKKGDLVAVTVRRGCGHCNPCLMNRSDYCLDSDYKERGIKGLNGFQSEYVVDTVQNIIPIPKKARDYGVLTEPMAVVQKGIDAASRAELGRMSQLVDPASCFTGRRVLIAGLGPVGILAALALRLRGAEVVGLDVLDVASENSQLLIKAGGSYLDGRQKNIAKALKVDSEPLKFIIDTTGSAKLEMDLISMLGHNGVYTILGIPPKGVETLTPTADLIQKVVLKNLTIIGSVNESRMHMVNAVRDLNLIADRWGEAFIKRIITHKFPYTDFSNALTKPHKGAIKSVRIVAPELIIVFIKSALIVFLGR